jgi:S1-C subfamily serine protease
MKKVLWGIILLVLTSVGSNALDQQEAINRYLKGRQLDQIEGIWIATDTGSILAIYKDGNSFAKVMINSGNGIFSSGDRLGTYTKSSSTLYVGNDSYVNYQIIYTPPGLFQQEKTERKITGRYSCESRIFLNSLNSLTAHCLQSHKQNYSRVWPDTTSTLDNSSAKKRGGSGSAFFINSKGNILTNNHVVDGCARNIKIIHDKKESVASIIAKDSNLDLALLSSNIKPQHFIKLSKKSGDKLDKVVVAGYPLGYTISDELKFTSGIVSATKGWKDNTNEMQIDAALNPGNSGGPVVNDAGNLFGVAVAAIPDRQNLNFAIKSKAVKDFLDVNKIDYSTAAIEFDMDNKKRLKLLEDSTVFIYCN